MNCDWLFFFKQYKLLFHFVSLHKTLAFIYLTIPVLSMETSMVATKNIIGKGKWIVCRSVSEIKSRQDYHDGTKCFLLPFRGFRWEKMFFKQVEPFKFQVLRSNILLAGFQFRYEKSTCGMI